MSNKETTEPVVGEAFRKLLESTIGDDFFSAETIKAELDKLSAHDNSKLTEAGSSSAASQHKTSANAFYRITEQDIDSRLNVSSPDSQNSHNKRYNVKQNLGEGATGQVYSATDNTFNREIAIKFMQPEHSGNPGKISNFLKEARVTAKLCHSNILPIYDLNLEANGQPYFTMRKIKGTSLGDLIRVAENRQRLPKAIANFYERVSIMLKVCDALSYAHSKGVIHHDVKPDNIMLSNYGEVMLLDWGTACSCDIHSTRKRQGKMFGTPAYMAPEQARKEFTDERTDVYCMGATLFHLLFLRHSMWANTPQEFWDKKKLGILDPITDEERLKVPPALLSITMKALSSSPKERYQTIEELAEDLKLYQEGLAVSAHYEGTFKKIQRFYTRNKKTVLFTGVALFLISFLTTMFYKEKMKEKAHWQVKAFYNFNLTNDQILKSKWSTHGSASWKDTESGLFGDTPHWSLKNNKLVGYSHSGFRDLTYRERIPGNLKVEWNITPLLNNMNLNSYIAGIDRSKGYTFHCSSWSSATYCAITQGKDFDLLTYSHLKEPLKVGKTYKFCMIKENRTISFSIDNKVILQATVPVIQSNRDNQTFGFDVCSNTYAIDDVKIYYQPLAEKISPIVVADTYLQDGFLEIAYNTYKELNATYKDSRYIHAETLQRMIICAQKLNRNNEVLSYTSSFIKSYPDHIDAYWCMLQKAKTLNKTGKISQATKIYENLATPVTPPEILQEALIDISIYQSGGIHFQDPEFNNLPLEEKCKIATEVTEKMTYWIKKYRTIPFYLSTLSTSTNILNNAGRHDKVLALTPMMEYIVANTLIAQGKFVRFENEYKDQFPLIYFKMLKLKGDFQTLLKVTNGYIGSHITALTETNQIDKINTFYTEAYSNLATAYCSVGNYQEAYNICLKYNLQSVKFFNKEFADICLHLGDYEKAQQIMGEEFADSKQEFYMLTFVKKDYYKVLNNHLFKKISTYPTYAATIALNTYKSDPEIYQKAIESLANYEYHYMNFDQENIFACFLLPSIMQTLRQKQDISTLNRYLNQTMDTHEYKLIKILWHDCGFLRDKISLAEFKQQPKKYKIEERLTILQGIKAELNNDNDLALKFYNKCLSLKQYNKTGIYYQFCSSRIKELSNN